MQHYHRSMRATAALLSAILLGVPALCLSTRGDEPPVASFRAAEGDHAGADRAAPAGPDNSAIANGGPKLSFNFRYAPWTDVLRLFAETVGLTLDLTDTPPGTFNYFDTKKYTPTEALDVLNGYLLPRGFLLIRRDRFLVCLDVERGIPPHLVPQVSLEELATRGDNELLTVVFAVPGGRVDQAATEVQQLLGPHGKAVPLSGAGSILVTDAGRRLRLIRDLLSRSDFSSGTAAAGEQTFRAFPLQHISAREGERLVREMFGPAGGGGSTSRAVNGPGRPPAPGDVRMSADIRTNSLLVTAAPDRMDNIAELLSAADVPALTGPAENGPDRFRSEVHVVPLGSADVARIGRTLESLSPRIRVSTTGGVPRPAGVRPGASTEATERAAPAAVGRPAASDNSNGADPAADGR